MFISQPPLCVNISQNSARLPRDLTNALILREGLPRWRFSADLCDPWIATSRDHLLLLILLVGLLRIWCYIPHHSPLRRREELRRQLPQKDQNVCHRALIIVHRVHNELPEILILNGCGLLKLLTNEFQVIVKLFGFAPGFFGCPEPSHVGPENSILSGEQLLILLIFREQFVSEFEHLHF